MDFTFVYVAVVACSYDNFTFWLNICADGGQHKEYWFKGMRKLLRNLSYGSAHIKESFEFYLGRTV